MIPFIYDYRDFPARGPVDPALEEISLPGDEKSEQPVSKL